MLSIIGTGPAGSHLAGIVKDQDVMLFDKKSQDALGTPIQCTGIFTNSIYRVLDIPDELVLNRIKTFRMKAPNGKSVDIDVGKENLVVDRTQFDRWLMQRARDNGAKIMPSHEFVGYKEIDERVPGTKHNRLKLLFKDKDPVMTDYLVGADGPYSPVAKAAGMYGDRQFLDGLQYRVSGRFEPDVTDIYFGVGEFAWLVPESSTVARIGVIGKNVQAEFEKLTKGMKILEDQSGPIPLYNHKQKLVKGNVALIGDAATQVKATTYGGIIYGLLAGKYVSEGLDDYPSKFNAKLGKDLWVSLKMRQALNKFDEKDCSELIGVFEKDSNKKILEEHDRDFPSKFILQLLMKETKLWKLGFKLFK